MSSTTLTFTLEKKAKSAGGDKYVCSLPEFNIYVPQTISRNSSQPFETLIVTIDSKQNKEN